MLTSIKAIISRLHLIEKIYVLLGIAFFSVLASFAYQHKPLNIDILVTCSLQAYTYLESFMRAISLLGDNFFVAVAIVLTFTALLHFVKQSLEAKLLLFITAIGQSTNAIIKLLIARPRPAGEACVQVLVNEQTLSFPSGHVMHYVCLYGFLCFVIYKKINNLPLKIILMVLPAFLVLSIGASRIYLGAHWFTDVTAGYLLSSILLIFTINFYYHIKKAG